MRTRKRQEFPLHDPVEITVLHLLKVLVRVNVEGVKREKATLASTLDAAEAVKDGEVVCADAGRGVMEGREGWVHAMKRTEGVFRGAAQVHHGVCGEKEGGVGAFVGVSAGVEVDALARMGLVVKLGGEDLTESVQLSQVQGPKVKKEVPVHKLIVDGEEVGRGALTRDGAQSNVIQSVLDELNGFGQFHFRHDV